MAQPRPSSSALDIILKSLISTIEFNELQDKNWDAISKVLPGTTPRQCQKRYEELCKTEMLSAPYLLPTKRPLVSSMKSSSSEVRLARPSSGKLKTTKSEKDLMEAKMATVARMPPTDQSPVMVIHVCDEAKNVKQDFQCPRNLLINEMKYFSEYLSTDAQRWEEVDISVHCDVAIFDWLMRYVKKGQAGIDVPTLEASNVISILISSEFLKMNELVDICIDFCHKNMSAIVSTPCNMNCINDELITRISQLFNHNEADDIRDRKDKFKSKIFQKKIEKLFEPAGQNQDSAASACELFRCSACRKILTYSMKEKVDCTKNRLYIDRQGSIVHIHQRDGSWDVNDYIQELKDQLKSWVSVYWVLWGTINYLTCCRCAEVFPCTQIGQCRYHTSGPVFDEKTNSAHGHYPCCNAKTQRFHPLQRNKGCMLRSHAVLPEDAGDSKQCAVVRRLYEDLMKHRDTVCAPVVQEASVIIDNDEPIDIFQEEELALGLRTPAVPESPINDRTPGTDNSKLDPQPRLQALTKEEYDDDKFDPSEDDEIGDDEEPRVRKARSKRVTVAAKAILVDGPAFDVTKRRKWDATRSVRWNQDAQREEDQRRMNEITTYLAKLRTDTTKSPPKEYAGGIFCKLEAQWKTINMPPPKAPAVFPNRKQKLSQITK